MPLAKTYEELEYITVDGNQYFDTGFKPNQATSVEMSYDLNTGEQGGTLFFGSSSSWSTASFGIYRNGNATKIFSNYNDDTNITGVFSVASFNGRHIVKRDRNLTYLDGTLKYTHGAKSFQSTRNLLICNTNDQIGTTNYAFIGKIYYVKVWEDGELIRDFVPAKKLKDNTIGLYDKVNKVFYTNQGTGAPTGTSKSTIAYIEEAVSQVRYIDPQMTTNWFNANINTTTTTSVKYRFRVDNAAALSGTDKVIFGSTRWNSNAFLLCMQSAKFCFFGASPYQFTTVTPAVGHTYYFVLTKNNNSISMTITDETTGSVETKNTTDSYNGYPIYIGHCTGSTAASGYPNAVSTIDCSIANGTVERKFIPVKYGNEYCLLDTVEKKLYFNQGTGTFKSGNVMTYEILESIESTGTQYIDTGVLADTNTELFIDASFKTLDNANSTMGAYQPGKRFHIDIYQNKFLFGITNVYQSPVVADTNRHTFWIKGNGEYGLDDQKWSLTKSGDFPTVNILLMNRQASSGGICETKAVLYSAKIKTSTTTMNFVPARRMEDGAIGLLDTTSNTFYENKGTGEFIAHSLPTPEYIGLLQTYSVEGLTKKLQGYQNAVSSPAVSSYTNSSVVAHSVVAHNCYRICRQLCYLTYRYKINQQLEANTNYALVTRITVGGANNSTEQTLHFIAYNNLTSAQTIIPCWIQSNSNKFYFRLPDGVTIPSGTGITVCGVIRYNDGTY